MQTNKTRTQKKKEEVKNRMEKMDPNNNRNIPEQRLIKKRGKKSGMTALNIVRAAKLPFEEILKLIYIFFFLINFRN